MGFVVAEVNHQERALLPLTLLPYNGLASAGHFFHHHMRPIWPMNAAWTAR